MNLLRMSVGSTSLVELLCGNEVVHISMCQWNFVHVLFAKHFFLGEGGWGELREGVSDAA